MSYRQWKEPNSFDLNAPGKWYEQTDDGPIVEIDGPTFPLFVALTDEETK